MSFPQHHWNNPRETIAVKYKDNDYGYTMHAAKIVNNILEYIDEPHSSLKNKSILDYGCGTGRMASLMSFVFDETYGFDVNENCISMAYTDLSKVDFQYRNLSFGTEVPDKQYDYVYSVSVLEHLDQASFIEAMCNITRLTKNKAILWFSYTKNPLMDRFAKISRKNNVQIDIITLTKDELVAGMNLLNKQKLNKNKNCLDFA